MSLNPASFDVSKEDMEMIGKIIARFRNACNQSNIKIDVLSATMDLTACHANGTPLDLEKMLKAPLSDLFHDISGIARHIDRDTGVVGGCFLPRCARKVAA